MVSTQMLSQTLGSCLIDTHTGQEVLCPAHIHMHRLGEQSGTEAEQNLHAHSFSLACFLQQAAVRASRR